MTNKIRAVFVFEIMGRPAEHIVSTLNMFIDKLAEIPAVTIEDRKIHEPKLIEKENIKDIYTTFAEIELTANNLEIIFDIVLQMLPAHVEIVEPAELRLQNFELSGTLSNLAIKLHKYDEIAKSALIERDILMKRLNEMQEKINELEKSGKSKKKATKQKSEKKVVKKSVKKKKTK